MGHLAYSVFYRDVHGNGVKYAPFSVKDSKQKVAERVEDLIKRKGYDHEILKKLGIEGEWEGIGHCAVGYMDCKLPAAPARKDGRVFWAE